MATPETPLTEEEHPLQMGDSAVKKLQDKLTAKIQDLGIRVKETEKVLETSGAKLRLKVEGSPSAIEQLKEQVAYAEELKQVMNQIHAAKDLDQIFVELREGILGLLDAASAVALDGLEDVFVDAARFVEDVQEILAADASHGLRFACREADDLAKVWRLEARARQLALFAFDHRRVLARARDAQARRVRKLALDTSATARTQYPQLAPQDLIDLPRSRRGHDHARIGERTVVPERDNGRAVALRNLVTGRNGNALVISDSIDDIALLSP